jgi:frataxin
MSIDDATFETLAEAALQAVSDRLEDSDADNLDVDFDEGVLTIEVDDGGTFLLNKHAPLKQIWLSSPKSGASHYAYDADSGRWISTRDSTDLLQLLAAEMAQVTGVDVRLD